MLTAARVFYLLCDWPQSPDRLCEFVRENIAVLCWIDREEPAAADHICGRLEARAVAFGESA